MGFLLSWQPLFQNHASLAPNPFDDGSANLRWNIEAAPLERLTERRIVENHAFKIHRLRVTRRDVPVDMRIGQAVFEGRVRLGLAVVAGGVIPAQDYQALRDAGVQAIFGPGTNLIKAAEEVLRLLGHNMPPAEAA